MMDYNVREHKIASIRIAELLAEETMINTTEEALQLLGDLYYSGFDAMVLHQQNLTSEFFDLKNGMAGEILQKFSNYRMRLFVIGDFSSVSSGSLLDFIRESNKGKHVNFVNSLEDVLSRVIV